MERELRVGMYNVRVAPGSSREQVLYKKIYNTVNNI